MKVLSLLQPWATLVVIGAKTIETRSWNTKHRGDLLIHASGGKKGAIFSKEFPFMKYIPDFDALPFGAIIGKVNLADTFRFDPHDIFNNELAKLTLEEKAFGDYTPGRYGWKLDEPIQFSEPIPQKGALMLWEFPEELIEG